jgi:hypothetical protein
MYFVSREKCAEQSHSWVCHLASIAASRRFTYHIGRAAAQAQGSRYAAARDGTDARRVRESNFGEEKANAHSSGRLDGGGNEPDEPLAHTREGQEHEDDAFEEDGSQGSAVGD